MRVTFVAVRRIAALSVGLTMLTSFMSAQSSGATPSPQVKPPVMEGYPALGAPPIVTVLSAGAAPRTQLRYVVPPAQNARFEATTNLTMGMVVGQPAVTQSMAMKSKVTATLAVTSSAAGGDIAYDIAFAAVAMDVGDGKTSVAAQQTQAFLDLISSIKGHVTVSDRGVVRSSNLSAVDPRARAVVSQAVPAVESLSVPLPEEAVGVGARWEVRQTMIADGPSTFHPTVFHKTEYRVVKMDGVTVSLDVKTEQIAPPQPVDDPSQVVGNAGVVFNARMQVDQMSGTGKGTVVVRLNSLVPTSTLEWVTSLVGTTSANAQAMSMKFAIQIRTTIGPPQEPKRTERPVGCRTFRFDAEPKPLDFRAFDRRVQIDFASVPLENAFPALAIGNLS